MENIRQIPYSSIVKHYEECFKEYGDNSKGVDWPNKQDALKRYQVMLEVMKFDTNSFKAPRQPSVLDFGCGLGHLYEYITQNAINVHYTGLDASSLFAQTCREKFPHIDFLEMDILDGDVVPAHKFDYIVMNGVLTEKKELSYDEMWTYSKKLIQKVYQVCNYGVAFNVMSKDVDWERDDLFHLPVNELSKFLTQEITRDFIIRYDYGLYEYTTYLYKKGSK